ncbi:MAG: alpha/beta hydrolase [Rhodocyclaceae bacterium]|nr:alpha/beta hydrolase [Rhodocyclaceae bacterium]
MSRRQKAAALLAAFLLAGCACGVPVADRQGLAQRLAEAGMSHRRILSAGFPVHAWLRGHEGRTLTVVIEGDGAAWFSPQWPPADPTPDYSLALALAREIPGAVAYLGRPCQFEMNAACRIEHWTRRRFSPELVEALDRALDALKQESGADRLRLVGHSGGGVMAVLLAARRHDVSAVLTLMSPLALSLWTQSQMLTPLSGLDPLAEAPLSQTAIHVAGGRDPIVPAASVRAYVAAKGGDYLEWPDADHACWPIRRALSLIEEMP